MRIGTRFLIVAVAAIPAAVMAQDAAVEGAGTAQGELGITIYSDRALVVDTRNLTLPGGVSRQEFPDVSAAIRPETVSLEASGVEVVEQNFDFDLLSPTSMMQAAVGEDVTLLRTDPATGQQSRETARVLAVNGGVVMQTASHVEVLRDDGLPVRVLFDGIPANLRARPTLSVTLEAASAGARPVKLSYLTTGLGWKADYVALYDEPSKTIGLQGWVTLTNTTGTPFHDAKLTLAAGDLMKLQQRPRRGTQPNTRSTGEYGDGEEETVGDLHLYPVEGRTTVASNQTKQVSFLEAAGVAASRGYRFECDWPCASPESESATSVLSFSTGAKGGLGQSLPAGVVRVYMRDGEGEARFVGESLIEHTPTGSALDLETALAFDVKVQAIVETRERVTEQTWVDTARHRIVTGSAEPVVVTTQRQPEAWRTTIRYAFSNARPDEVEVELRQNELQGWYNATRVSSETQPGAQDGADTRVWKVKVPGRGKSELTVTYLTRF